MSYSESKYISRHIIIKKEQLIKLFELFLDKDLKMGNVKRESDIDVSVTFSDSSQRKLKNINDLEKIETSKKKNIRSIHYSYKSNNLSCSIQLISGPEFIGNNIKWEASGVEEGVVIIMRDIENILNKDQDILIKVISFPTLAYFLICSLIYIIINILLIITNNADYVPLIAVKNTNDVLYSVLLTIYIFALIHFIKAMIGKVTFIWGNEDLRYKNIKTFIALLAYILPIAIPILI